MIKLPPYSAIIFDMDGLVLDTESSYFQAWKHAINAMNYPFHPVFFSSLLGIEFKKIGALLIHHYGSKFDLNVFEKLSAQYWYLHAQQEGINIKHGFETLLAVIRLHQIPYCLATNSPRKNAQECLAFAGLQDVFTLIISQDNVQQAKPAPDIFLTAAKQLNQPISQCLVLEDSLIGLKAARRATAPYLFIPSFPIANNEPLIQGQPLLSDLAEVSQIILANLPQH